MREIILLCLLIFMSLATIDAWVVQISNGANKDNSSFRFICVTITSVLATLYFS